MMEGTSSRDAREERNRMNLEMFSVRGRCALVTGASRGIGRAIARVLVDAGVVVYGTGRTPSSVAAMTELGVQGRVADVRDKGAAVAILDEIIERHGRLDCLINNAGLLSSTPAGALKAEQVDDLFDTNFKAGLWYAQAYYRKQRRRGGNVVNIASVLGLRGLRGSSAYCASKGALLQMTRALSAEWAPYGWRVNAVCPGLIETDMNDGVDYHKATSLIPMRRAGNPDDIAGPVLFLMSDASRYVTGQTLIVDGGMTSAISVVG